MVGAAVSLDELHPPRGESLEGLDLRGVYLIADVARDHAATLPADDRSGGADLLGAAEVELGGGGPAAEQGLARLEVAAGGEGAEVHGLVAQAVQQRGDELCGPVVVGGERDRPTGRVAVVAAVLLDVVVADVVQRLDDVRAGQARGEQLARGELAGVVAELGAGGVDGGPPPRV